MPTPHLQSPEATIDIAREAMLLLLQLSLPILLTALILGLLVGLFQALTQVQEPTLVFVPKFLLVMAMISLLLPYMGNLCSDFYQSLMGTIIGI